MPRKKTTAKTLVSESSSDEEALATKMLKRKKLVEDSSSESDIENYLQPADQIDLNSSFFDVQKQIPPLTDEIEDDVFESDEETDEPIPAPSTSHFQQLRDYTKKMEDARKQVEAYKARKQAEEKQTDVLNLLAAGETKNEEHDLDVSLRSSDFDSCSESEKEGWEEVEDVQKSTVPKENLEIIVEMPGRVKKKKSDLIAVIKRRMNRIKKHNQMLIHKVHLLCWIAHGNYVNGVINSKYVLAATLSLVPPQLYRSTNHIGFLEKMVNWYKHTITNLEVPLPNRSLEELLQDQIARKESYNKLMLVYIFVAVLRSLKIECRLVLSFQVEPVRPPKSELFSLSTKNNTTKPKADDDNNKEPPETATAGTSKLEAGENRRKTRSQIKNKTETKKSSSKLEILKVKNEEVRNKMGSKIEESKKTLLETKKKSSSKLAITKLKNEEVQNKIESKIEEHKKTILETKKKSSPKLEIPKMNPEEVMKTRSKSAAEAKMKQKIEETMKTRSKSTIQHAKKETGKVKASDLIAAFSKKTRSKSTRKLKVTQLDGPMDDSSDDDFATTSKPKLRNLPHRLAKIKNNNSDSVRTPFSPKNSPQTSNMAKFKVETLEIKQNRNDVGQKNRKRRNNREIDDDEEYTPVIKKKQFDEVKTVKKQGKKSETLVAKNENNGMNIWAEIFLESEKRWISVDVIEGVIDCVDKLYAEATHPISYIMAWNNDNTIKDVTCRYCKEFNTATRKLRIDSKWWIATLKPFKGAKTTRDKKEDEELERGQLETPLPKTFKEYKNHPLYVLKRHLLKYEAIYPPDTPTLGFVRKEPVYPRQCVHILHPRHIWFKQAKIVKPGEKGYKIVKGRPRWDKLAHKIVTDPEEEVFGTWQVQDYEPPTAENGIVPRNAYGNVELYKPNMLPKKTVHLRLPGINRIAKRMNIDCAPAFRGFDYYNGWIHPAYDGYVVCEENADILVAAWELEQDELEQKEQEKIDKRVYMNWKKLIKGLLIREHLIAKYEFGNVSRHGSDKKAKRGPRFATKKRK